MHRNYGIGLVNYPNYTGELTMPATAAMRNGKWRVIEADTGELVKQHGSPVDGGGHKTKKQAQDQAKAINANS